MKVKGESAGEGTDPFSSDVVIVRAPAESILTTYTWFWCAVVVQLPERSTGGAGGDGGAGGGGVGGGVDEALRRALPAAMTPGMYWVKYLLITSWTDKVKPTSR